MSDWYQYHYDHVRKRLYDMGKDKSPPQPVWKRVLCRLWKKKSKWKKHRSIYDNWMSCDKKELVEMMRSLNFALMMSHYHDRKMIRRLNKKSYALQEAKREIAILKKELKNEQERESDIG